MLLKLDLISKTIDINYSSYSRHSSTYGAILTVLVTILGLAFAILSLNQLFQRKTPYSNMIVKFEDNVGIYNLNNKELFHALAYFNVRLEQIKWDLSLIQAVGTLTSLNGNIEAEYYYSHCINERDFVEEFSFNIDLTYALCISSAKNFTTGEIIHHSLENTKTFPFPQLRYGMESKNSNYLQTIYSIKIKYCGEFDKDYKNCDASKRQFLDNETLYFSLFFVDNQVDVTNYDSPILKLENRFGGTFDSKTTSINSLNFDTFEIQTNDNLIFDNSKIQKGYVYRQNEIFRSERVLDSDDLINYGFYLKNQQTKYYRKYTKAQETLANIGGFFNFIYISAVILNYYSNVFQIVLNSIYNFQDNKFYLRSQKSTSLSRIEVSRDDDRNKIPNLIKFNNKINKDKENNESVYVNDNNNESRKDYYNPGKLASFNLNIIQKNDNNQIIKSTNKRKVLDLENDLTNSDFSILPNDSFGSRLKFILRKTLFMNTNIEDKIILIRNSIMNEKTLTNLFLENIKIKAYLHAVSEANFLEKVKDQELYLEDLQNYCIQH